MSDLISIFRLIISFITGRARDQKAERLRLEQEAWQWLERHLCFFEEQAHKIYSLVLQNSAEKVLEELCDEKYPFVEKLSHFPLREDSALKINFRRLAKKDRQKAWAISNSYVETWNICIAKFPGGAPLFPHDLVKFEKANKVLKIIIA